MSPKKDDRFKPMFAAYPRNDAHKPGSWMPLKTPDGMSATFCCPKCGALGQLTSHEIGENGQVTPSVVCVNEPDCSFHEYIRLDGWSGL